jgi:hypothetical protein
VYYPECLPLSCSSVVQVQVIKNFFSVRKGPEIGIDFQNTIQTNDSLNALTFEYVYNGSGVGDFNNDGLEDLFLPPTRSPAGYT